ncbi:MAG: ParB/RepB/Spo0J family partition protein [Halanaerobiales bacterium]
MEFKEIPLDRIVRKEQSRKYFDKERLKQLADSINEVGQLQPIIVQKKDNNRYLLIAGERRYKAVKRNSKNSKISAAVLENVKNSKQLQLIENLQREDLNPLERAKSIQNFIEENSLSRKDAAKKLGIPRTTLTEWLNILEVKPYYQKMVIDEDSSLTLSHISLARGLANRTGDPSKLKNLLDGIIKYNFTRKETKEIVNLFYDHLHLSMEEAFATILIKRERKKVTRELNKKSGNNSHKTVNKLINTFNRVSQDLEKFMENVGDIDNEKARESLLDEFIYIYQLLELIIPEMKDKSLEKLKNEIKQGY